MKRYIKIRLLSIVSIIQSYCLTHIGRITTVDSNTKGKWATDIRHGLKMYKAAWIKLCGHSLQYPYAKYPGIKMEKAWFYLLFFYARVKPRWVAIYLFIKHERPDFILQGPKRLGKYFIIPFSLKHIPLETH